jgi:hypothetical protein
VPLGVYINKKSPAEYAGVIFYQCMIRSISL